MESNERAVAIVGVGAILPDAPNVSALWENIVNRVYSIGETPPDRWCIEDYYDPDPTVPDKTYSKIGGWVRGFQYDWKKYRMPPKVAAAMDQGQQWAVAIADQALSDYGYPQRPLDTERTGVILGTAMGGEMHYWTCLRISYPEYARALQAVREFRQLPPEVREAILERWHEVIARTIPTATEDTMPGELPNIVSGRVANIFNLRGPNFITDAACASSCAAVDSAVRLLIEERVDAVLTGGVDRNMGIGSFVKFCKIGALSATGTRPFGEGADGFVMGEGSASFLLKRLADAERSGDKIYAVIRGVGGASDGRGKGITAPNPIGQRLAVERAWKNAELDPATATLVEAHGTSTKVGDVVEVESLAAVFGGAPSRRIGLGSVKSNFGHLKAGAGAAGLLKAVMALHHKVLPPTLHCERPNPDIDFNRTPFYLLHEPLEWMHANGAPRRCGVSAYGFGGTNFHIVLEEHVPGALTETKVFAGARVESHKPGSVKSTNDQHSRPRPLRGIVAIGAENSKELAEKLDQSFKRAQGGWTPPLALPETSDIGARERLVIDFGDHDELLNRMEKAQRALGSDNPAAWKALQAQGIFRGSGQRPGKIAFLFPGQGSQYVNMGRQLAQLSPVVAQVFADANQVMTPILGRPLSDYVFLDSKDAEERQRAEKTLTRTEHCQPAMLTLDAAIYQLLGEYGFKPDMVMGHSLGEYASLNAAGIMPFAEALEAAAARGSEMSKIKVEDNGWMAAVMAPYDVVEQTLKEVDGYVVAANVNSYNQCVIGGASQAVERAIELFRAKGLEAQRLPVSHAFHTRIVAPAGGPLREVLDRLHISRPRMPLVGNVNGEFYPDDVNAIKDILQQQIASPVQWVKGLETLYAAGARAFVEVGPKKALKGFVDDVLGGKTDVVSLYTNHPKTGELQSFNQALCGLYAAGYDADGAQDGLDTVREEVGRQEIEVGEMAERKGLHTNGSEPMAIKESHGNGKEPTELKTIAEWLDQLADRQTAPTEVRPFDRNAPVQGSVVISGTGLGLPGAEKAIMDLGNALRILRGEQFIDLLPERFRRLVLDKRITRIVKSEDGSGRFETIVDPDKVIKLAGRPGSFDLHQEYGVPEKLIEALDITSQLAMAAGLDALCEARIPLVQTFKRATTGKYLPDRWMLPEPLRDETGVIFASAFPGADRFIDELKRYYTWQHRLDDVRLLEDLSRRTGDPDTQRELQRRLLELREALEREPYSFDRRFLFRIVAFGHTQFAEYIGARGPNAQVNAACASTTQAVAIAEDWIRSGRCRRVVVISADDVTNDNVFEWAASGFLSTGAAATDDRVEDAALPFDRRRHGMIIGMGAAALVVESQDAVGERGVRGIVELLSTETLNSAFHGTRLDVEHIPAVMDQLVTAAERRFGLDRNTMASQLVFVSHETYTPARGGSASAEIAALRRTFGPAANEIVITNTKGFTGHAMGAGVEDVIAVKVLEYGIVPPVPNLKEPDPELGALNLSRGGRYPVKYALHLAAGFGSQIAMTLIRRIPGAADRIGDELRRRRWLEDVSGYDRAETEIKQRTLRIRASGPPRRSPAPSTWKRGTGPAVLTLVPPDLGVDGKTAWPVPPPDWTIAPRKPAEPAGEPGSIHEVTAKERPAEPEPPVAKPERASAAQPAPLPVTTRVSASVAERVLKLVAEKTGYPREMLDLDLDLEADLGIDTVKQAETFAAIREEFHIPRQENLKLRDYPTLARVILFVKENADVTNAEPQQALGSDPISSKAHSVQTPDAVSDKVLEIVAAKTGYPREMLDLDLDLEADLGVDTVKQAETFAAIREEFAIPRQENLRLRDYPTLKHVIAFIRQMKPELVQQLDEKAMSLNGVMSEESQSSATRAQAVALAGPVPVGTANPAPQITQPAAPAAAPTADQVQERILEIVAAKTGYPIEMLDLDLDLEADLGIDTVKQAETFAAIREGFDIPRQENLKLRDYPTLARVIQFVREQVNPTRINTPTEEQGSSPVPPPLPSPSRGEGKGGHSIAEANRIPRRVPIPMLRPPLTLCKPTGVRLDQNTRVVVTLDAGGEGISLVEKLKARGVTTLVLEPQMTSDELEAKVRSWLAAGPIHGIYWLPALEVEPSLEDLDLEQWRELNRVRVKYLYATLRALYEAAPFLVTATRMGGLHGYGPEGASAPLGGAITGFAKAYKRERASSLVKAVDFQAFDPELLIAETLSDPGVVEVGYWDDDRFSIALEDQPVADNRTGMPLDTNTVFVITGAAGGITSAITADLAAASGGRFYLLDIVPPPDPRSELIRLFRLDKEACKSRFIEEAKAAGARPTPVQIEKQLFGVERQEAALRAIEAVQAAGGQAVYRQVNLLDAEAVSQVIEEIRRREGQIGVVVHAAGMEISRALPDKDPAQFNLVFDVKADGMFNLLRAAKGMPIGATVAFSSVAGRFGNSGQTDYSAANDLLCKVTSSMRVWRPKTRGIAIDWTAWGGIGMATRGSIPKIMEMAGIEVLPPECGIPTVRRELACSSFGGEVLVAGRLGTLTADWDEHGGLDLEKAKKYLADHKPTLVGVGEIKSAKLHGGLEVVTTLDPNVQPFLCDHQMEGVPLLPGVMGIEIFAELATVVAPGYHVAAVENVEYEAPYKFHRMQPRTLYLSASLSPVGPGELLAHTLLKSVTSFPRGEMPPQEKVHFSADVRLTRAALERPVVSPPALKEGGTAKDEIYRIFFHGPAYQVLDRVWTEGDHAVGVMSASLPPNTNPPDAASFMAPRLIELCYQTAGMWDFKRNGVLALPLALRSVCVYRQPEEAGGRRIYALVQSLDDGAQFDAQVVDEGGAVYAKLTGYRTVRLST